MYYFAFNVKTDCTLCFPSKINVKRIRLFFNFSKKNCNMKHVFQFGSDIPIMSFY